MSCCGNARRLLGEFALPASPAPVPAARRTIIVFEYVGGTALTVMGPASGRAYRFEAPGAQLAVDPRDRPGLARLRQLRELT